jgi:hypothetical protein
LLGTQNCNGEVTVARKFRGDRGKFGLQKVSSGKKCGGRG